MLPAQSTNGNRSEPITFYGFKDIMVPDECRAGLVLKEAGHIVGKNSRLRKVWYEGPRAGYVMKKLSEYAHIHVDTS